MSKNETAVPDTPSATYYDSAQARMDELHAIRDRMPHFVIPTSVKETSRLNNAASVPPEFVELTAVALTNERSLVRGDAATPAGMRDLRSYASAYAPFADELEAFAKFVRHSVNYARNQAGIEALTIYALAKRLAKRPATAHLLPHVADMRRALGRTRAVTAEKRRMRAEAKAAKAAKTTEEPS